MKIQGIRSIPPIEEVLSSKGKIKILKILTFNDSLNISAIVRRARINHALVSQHLEYFTQIGVVKQKNYGRIRVFWLANNKLVSIIRGLIENWERLQGLKEG